MISTLQPHKDNHGNFWWPVSIGSAKNWSPVACVRAESAEHACSIMRELNPTGKLYGITREK